jgi:hypothetical protein
MLIAPVYRSIVIAIQTMERMSSHAIDSPLPGSSLLSNLAPVSSTPTAADAIVFPKRSGNAEEFFPEPSFVIPHETLWRSASDTVITEATRDLAAAADSVPARLIRRI